MAVKVYKPTTPGRRQMSVVDYSVLSKVKPHKPLLVRLNSLAGRGHKGRISVRRRGGGVKKLYRIIDFWQKQWIVGTIKTIEYDPYRTCFISLVYYRDGDKRYVLTPEGVKIEDTIVCEDSAEIKVGNRLKIKNIPLGMSVCNVELQRGRGGQMIRSAGSSAKILSSDAGYVQLKLPSGEVRLIDEECFATIGVLSNLDHKNVKIGKAWRNRWKGKRPSVRGKAMNPVDHPHGWGEAGCAIGLIHPKTPWWKPALGYKTRRNKRTGKYIVKGRKKRR